MDAGRLRHRVTIERRVNRQDATTGETVPVWLTFAANLPAAIEPLSVRETMAAAAVQSQLVARIVIRYRAGIDATMRVKHGSTVYNIEGVLADADTGRDYLTLPCSAGVNDG
jgi:SPP1 family predicted phage head-tail adaptor